MPQTYAVPPAAPQNHGKTVAAWVMFLGVVAGSVVVALGLVLAQMMLVWVGSAVILLTIAASVGLKLAGHGQTSVERREAAAEAPTR